MKNRVDQGLAYLQKVLTCTNDYIFILVFLLCIQFDVLILLAPVVKTGNHYIDHN